jgi:hypothetical protein
VIVHRGVQGSMTSGDTYEHRRGLVAKPVAIRRQLHSVAVGDPVDKCVVHAKAGDFVITKC